MTTHLPLLTTSAAKQYRACPRMYWLSSEQGYRSAFDDPNRAFGTLKHRGLEAWWTERMSRPTDPDAWLRVALSEIARQSRDDFDHEKALALMVGYHAMWADEPMEVLAVERQFQTDLRNPATSGVSKTWGFGGKIDAIVRIDGEVWIVEHKTSSEDFSSGSDYRIRLQLDHQVSNYIAGARSLGFDPKGCIYDVIGKPGQKPLKATPEEARKYTKPTKTEPSRLYAGQRLDDESPAEYGARIAASILESPEKFFARWPVVRLADEEREAAFDLWQCGVQIRESRAANAWPRNPDACKRYGRSCDYLAACAGHASLEDPMRFRKAEKRNEELEEGEKAA